MIAADMDVGFIQNTSRYPACAGGWFRQSHTTFLALLVVLNICVDLAAFRPDHALGIDFFWAGILLTQAFLMGLWMAFGGLHPLVRGFLVASIIAGGASAASVSSFAGLNGAGAFMLLAPVAGVVAFATHALLLPARMLLSWRIDFNPAYHAAGRTQWALFRILDCLGLMTAESRARSALARGRHRPLAANAARSLRRTRRRSPRLAQIAPLSFADHDHGGPNHRGLAMIVPGPQKMHRRPF